jgi:hypothetical protein
LGQERVTIPSAMPKRPPPRHQAPARRIDRVVETVVGVVVGIVNLLIVDEADAKS